MSGRVDGRIGRRTVLLALAASAAVAGGAAYGLRWTKRDGRKELLIAGSSSMHMLLEAMVREFSKRTPEIDILVEKGSSLSALRALKRGAIDLAAMSRDLTVPEDSLRVRNFMIARNEIRILVNQALPVKSLSAQQIRSLFSGDITNWKKVGGPDAPVHVISRKDLSVARLYIENVLLEGLDIVPTAQEMETDQHIVQRIAADPHALGFIALNYQPDMAAGLACLEVDGVAPLKETAYSGRYPLIESFYLVCGDKDGPVRDFIAFALSAAGQKIVAQQHFIPVG